MEKIICIFLAKTARSGKKKFLHSSVCGPPPPNVFFEQLSQFQVYNFFLNNYRTICCTTMPRKYIETLTSAPHRFRGVSPQSNNTFANCVASRSTIGEGECSHCCHFVPLICHWAKCFAPSTKHTYDMGFSGRSSRAGPCSPKCAQCQIDSEDSVII